MGDLGDDTDPGWVVPWGLGPEHRAAAWPGFGSGLHTLTVECEDTGGARTRIQVVLDILPVPAAAARLPLLLVDDVEDRTSHSWTDQWGVPRDNDVFRDFFWEEVLAGTGGVSGFDGVRDALDLEISRSIELRDLVDYRSVIWTTRYSMGARLRDVFQPPRREYRYNWLHAFQESVGDLFLIGERVLNEFMEDQPAQSSWMLPFLFDTDEEHLLVGSGVYTVGCGSLELADGSEILLGPQRYPYRSLGVAVLSHITPKYSLYGLSGTYASGSLARSARCGGIKGLRLDADFAAAHAVGGAIPELIPTDPVIDWRDDVYGEDYYAELHAWSWPNDEFYDASITDRATPWAPTTCGAGPCVEPMFCIHTRFAWVDERQEAAGEPDWPATRFTEEELISTCGAHLLDESGQPRTENLVTGFVSHRLDGAFAGKRGDVVWGFDPSRFDRAQIKAALRWVLGEYFGLAMGP